MPFGPPSIPGLAPPASGWLIRDARCTRYRLALVLGPEGDILLLALIGDQLWGGPVGRPGDYLDDADLAARTGLGLGDAQAILPWLAEQGWATPASLAAPAVAPKLARARRRVPAPDSPRDPQWGPKSDPGQGRR